MSYSCRILTDSSNELFGQPYRLTTFEIEFPRMVLAEFNTHTILSRNSASSRAIPVKKQLKRVLDDPYVPFYWGKNVPGMQAPEPIPAERVHEAETAWLRARDLAVLQVLELLLGTRLLGNQLSQLIGRSQETILTSDRYNWAFEQILEEIDQLMEDEQILNVHKQLANRLLEPFMWHTVITTGTNWKNYFGLRCHNDAQPEIRVIAEMMRDVYGMELPDETSSNRLDFTPYQAWAKAGYEVSQPQPLLPGEWHTPLVTRGQIEEYGIDWETARDVSAGRCARVSYLTHDGRVDWQADIELATSRLAPSGHMSPFQHVGRAMQESETPMMLSLPALNPNQQSTVDNFSVKPHVWSGNFQGFVQYRKLLPNEFDFSQVRALRMD
ncbi:MAG: FAD-dependent thymidylate synthase [bacterium]